VVGAGADVVGSGAGAGAVLAVLGFGVAGLVAGAAAELPATPAGAGVADADGALLSATAEPSTTAGAAASRDVAVLAGPAAAAVVAQAPVPAAVLDALSMARICGALKRPTPAISATARSPAIAARRPRGFSSKLRYRRASRLR